MRFQPISTSCGSRRCVTSSTRVTTRRPAATSITSSRRRTAFAKPFVWWVKEDLDVGQMRAAAARFVGFHDFQSFSDDDPDEKSTQVLIDALEIYEDGELILIHIEGSHFIWKMVRRLVGVLVEIGRGGLTGRQRRQRC